MIFVAKAIPNRSHSTGENMGRWFRLKYVENINTLEYLAQGSHFSIVKTPHNRTIYKEISPKYYTFRHQ